MPLNIRVGKFAEFLFLYNLSFLIKFCSCDSSCRLLCTILYLVYRFLQELGWNENDESDDDCVIPEQDPAELEQIMMEVGDVY